jgi:hypothetical protein
VLGRRLVRVAHAEVDDVFAASSRLLLQITDDVEDVRREALDAREVGFHGSTTRLEMAGKRLTEQQ